jgi:hypothetical protein
MSYLFRSYIVVAASLITGLGCKFKSTSESKVYEEFQSAKYSLLYPKEWKIDSSGISGALLTIIAPLESSNDHFSENIILTTIELPDSINDIAKFINANKNEISELGDSLVIEKKKSKDSSSFYQIESENSSSGSLSKYLQAIWLGNQKIYLLTCICEKKNLKTYYGIFQKVISSFKLNR